MLQVIVIRWFLFGGDVKHAFGLGLGQEPFLLRYGGVVGIILTWLVLDHLVVDIVGVLKRKTY